jgi:hypothetical protein
MALSAARGIYCLVHRVCSSALVSQLRVGVGLYLTVMFTAGALEVCLLGRRRMVRQDLKQDVG